MNSSSVEGIGIVVCGTGFGHLWIDTLWLSRNFRLIGVIARGSDHSKRICRRYEVPLVTNVASIDEPVDAAVVAVGGIAGEMLALEWMRRGVPVLMEHPVRPAFLKEVRGMRNDDGHLFVNGHFSDLPEVRKFVDLCRKGSRDLEKFRVSFFANYRTLYSCIDIVADMLGEEHIAGLVRSRSWLRPQAGKFQVGPIQLHPFIVQELQSDDIPAASIGSHLIQCWLPEKHLILAGPTGPVITLNTDNADIVTWRIGDPVRAPSWVEFSAESRPAALLRSLRRLLRLKMPAEIAARGRRDFFVSLLCQELLAALP